MINSKKFCLVFFVLIAIGCRQALYKTLKISGDEIIRLVDIMDKLEELKPPPRFVRPSRAKNAYL